MPSNWLYIDTNFPSFTQKESDGEKIETMQDYLFMLVEQLRYTLRNLDLKNMNKAAMNGFLQNIREPIYAKIEDTNKNVNELSITAKGLSTRISNAEGSITQLGATADGLAAEIRNAKGDITQLGARADGLAARISSAEGNITQLGATANGLSARISSNEGSITNLTADVNGIRTQVSGKINSSEAQTLINQSLDGITLSASSDTDGTIFKLMYDGAVLASTGSVDLYVDAVNVYGTLTAKKLQGGSISILDDEGNRCGYIYSNYASSADTKIELDSDAIERTITITPTRVKQLLVPHILNGELAIELPSIAEKKAYIAQQLTEETWETELRIECPHKHYVNMTPAVAECRSRMYAELHGGKV